jgi:hypothetical protein
MQDAGSKMQGVSSALDPESWILHRELFAPVAQLDRAPDFESVGRGFESLRARFLSC